MKKITSVTQLDPNMQIKIPEIEGILWYSPLNKEMFNLCGTTVENEFTRLDQKDRETMQAINEGVSYLATHTAGLMIKFTTNSPKVMIDVNLNAPHDMPHMPATGQCGFDCYVFDEELNDYVLHDTAKYQIKESNYRVNLTQFYNYSSEYINRKYIINFPLYQGIKNVMIGLSENSLTQPLYFSNPGKIVVYGTSIAQGGCVSRPGMLYTNILSRWLDTEFINLGFSGNAMLEKPLASIIGKIKEQKLFIIDVEANAGIDERMKERLEEFLDEYLKYSPTTPILIVSRCLFSMDKYDQERISLNKFYIQYIQEVVTKYNQKGYNFSFLDGSNFFKEYKLNFTEFTVDGVHPTDFGSYLIALGYLDAIKSIKYD